MMAFRERVNDPWNKMGAAPRRDRERSDGAEAADTAIWRMTRRLGRDDAIARIRQMRDGEAAGYGQDRGGWTDAMIDGFVNECNRHLRDRGERS
jgi:hypothetical protein